MIGLEKFELKSFMIQFVGFTLLVLGNLTYNEAIEWKFFGLNRYMSKYLGPDGELLVKVSDSKRPHFTFIR